MADRKVWPDARTGAKGQRPTQGRAGAGLVCPAGTGAGADAILMTQRSRKLVLTLALTFNPLPQERKSRRHVFIFSADHPANPVARISKDAANDSPSPPTGVGGEGRGEVARDTNFLVAGCKSLLDELPVTDIDIQEVPIEDVIRQIFAR